VLNGVLKKINKCVNFEMLYCLEEDFNSIGLTLQPTKQNRVVLCTIHEGRPKAQKIFDDYIHIGDAEDRSSVIPKQLVECIKDFVIENVGPPSKLEDGGASWQKAQNSIYGAVINWSQPIDKPSQNITTVENIAAGMEDIKPPHLTQKISEPSLFIADSDKISDNEVGRADLPGDRELTELTREEVRKFLQSLTKYE